MPWLYSVRLDFVGSDAKIARTLFNSTITDAAQMTGLRCVICKLIAALFLLASGNILARRRAYRAIAFRMEEVAQSYSLSCSEEHISVTPKIRRYWRLAVRYLKIALVPPLLIEQIPTMRLITMPVVRKLIMEKAQLITAVYHLPVRKSQLHRSYCHIFGGYLSQAHNVA